MKMRHKNMVVKGRPGNSAEKTNEKSESDAGVNQSALAMVVRQNAGVLLLAAAFVVPNLTALLWPHVATAWGTLWPRQSPGHNAPVQDESYQPHTPIEAHQRAPLREKFSVNYEEVMRIRQENMKRYSYDYNVFGIDRRGNLSLQEYRDVYDGKWPVIVTDVVPTWRAFNWTREFFLEKYGDERVTMKAFDRVLDSAIAGILPVMFPHFHLGIDPAKERESAESVGLALPLRLFYKNTDKAFPNSWTYVEDELFIPMRPELRADIGVCEYLREDYYSLFPEDVRPWNAMLLWGTAFSRSTLHMDPYNWTGTNAVLQGLKRWRMYPPGQDHFLSVLPGARSGFPLDTTKYNSPIDAFEPDFKKYPEFAKATAIEFDQQPGELLLIPTGWFHQAYNVEETIAVSSQVMNRNNFRIVMEEILLANPIKRTDLPPDVDSYPPEKQVQALMDVLPPHIIERGRAVTKDVLEQIRYVGKPKRQLYGDVPPPK